MNSLFPRQFDKQFRIALAAIALFVLVGVSLSAYLFSPKVAGTGYSPVQPVPYSHKLHAGDLGIDCRYCHSTVEKSAFAAVPAAAVCMNCHTQVKKDSPLLQPVRDAVATGNPVPWVHIHELPGYVYFNHAAHINSGVSCVTCHGRIDQMVRVRQVEPFNMAWCIGCHRDPAPKIRPVQFVTKLDWRPDRDPAEIGRELIAKNHINPPTNCSGCHR
jgi:hypothetical protein